MVQVNPYQLKKFVKHVCIVTKKFYDHELARKGVYQHLEKIKDKHSQDKDIAVLNQKINDLLEKQAAVTEVGLSTRVPVSIIEKIQLLQKQLNLAQNDVSALTVKNQELKKALDAISYLQESIGDTSEGKDEIERNVQKVEDKVDTEYRHFLRSELDKKISFLESSLKKLSKNEKIRPSKIKELSRKLEYYKKQLKVKS